MNIYKKLLFLFSGVFLTIQLFSNKNIYIIPFGTYDLDRGTLCYPLEDCLNNLGYNMNLTLDLESLNDVFLIVSFNNFIINTEKILEKLKKEEKDKLILFMWEPPTTCPKIYEKDTQEIFSKIFTWHDHLVDNERFFKFFLPVWHKFEMIGTRTFDEKKLCTLISSNRKSNYPNELYSERKKIIDFFENIITGDFDFYGRGWKGDYKNYKGPTQSKLDCLNKYKFCICYENTKDIPGYISEKILDCFVAGCVPIYWGANNIGKFIPKECFITREDFESDKELYDFIKKITKKEYVVHINNIKKFLASDQVLLFSKFNFVDTFLKNLIPNYDRSIAFPNEQLEILKCIDKAYSILEDSTF